MDTSAEQITPARPERLYWCGPVDHSGKPLMWLDGVPTRDLDADDIANLSDDQIEATVALGLYSQTAPKALRPRE